MGNACLGPQVLDLDCAAEAQRISKWLLDTVPRLGRRGAIIAISGGVDSSLCAALAARAFPRSKVLGLLLPERDSSSASTRLGRQVADLLGIDYVVENIGPTLAAVGCYERRDAAIRKLFPEYGPDWKCKIVIASSMGGKLHYFKLVVQAPDGAVRETRLPSKEYLEIVAATSFKQRIRKTLEYFHADRLNFAVIGTPNRLEYDQGFFVKNGDGSADVKPIAHLYKTQVYALARHLQIPDEICKARPTTDTYSMAQSQDEFYFALPYEKMDLALWAHNHGVAAAILAPHLGLSEQEAQSIYADIEAKRRTTAYLHMPPALVEPVVALLSAP
jgi:NAD+ synthase